jgi:hypothetical protein
MLAATIFGLALVPVFYAVIERLREGGTSKHEQSAGQRRLEGAVGD